ncbi:signal peptide peptidase SppA [soil metagenome]
MGFAINALVNLWRMLRNGYRRLLRRPPDFVVFEVSGSLPEFDPPVGFLRRRVTPGRPVLSLEEVRKRLRRLSRDGRVRGVVLRVQDLDAGWVALEEVRRELALYREGGGRVVAYLIDPDTRDYYLASAADEILATPLATVAVTGLHTRANFVRDALQRIGVEAEVFAVSPYKSAYDTFARQDFSHEAREQAERLASRRFEALVEAIADGRGIARHEARQKIDRAPFSACAAMKARLIDGVCYEDELPERLNIDGQHAKMKEWATAHKSLTTPYRRRSRRMVGVVSLRGAIVRGRSRKLPVPLPLIGREQAGSESVVAALRVAEKNARVAAVLFYVDSRGGDSLASDLIWREVQRINEKKPVVVLMGDAAASGGYYVAAGASYIVARRNTITGSIGVISMRPVAAELYGKLHVNPVAVERGAHSGLFDVSRPLTDDERQVLRGQVDSVYGEFKDRVIRGRGLDPERVEELAGGRVGMGTEACENGLVDEIGGWHTALDKARELGGIKVDSPEVEMKISPPKTGRPLPENPAESVRDLITDYTDAAADLTKTRVWALAPYTFDED